MDLIYQISKHPQELERLLSIFEGYWKTQSILALARAGLPTLQGLILTSWDEQTRERVGNFARQHGWTELLLRHDKKPEQPPYPMGGYNVPISDLDNEVPWYLHQDRIVILLEPYSPLVNSYNVSTLFHTRSRFTLEIVGPGFDASDLQRGHLSPHETIEIEFGASVDDHTSRSGQVLKNITGRTFISEDDYKESVRNRLIKLHKKFILKQKSFVDQHAEPDEVAIEAARRMLLKTGQTILLDHEDQYTPINNKQLSETLGYLKVLPIKCARYFPLKFPFVAASSFVNTGEKLVFWDIVVPALKFQSVQIS